MNIIILIEDTETKHLSKSTIEYKDINSVTEQSNCLKQITDYVLTEIAKIRILNKELRNE